MLEDADSEHRVGKDGEGKSQTLGKPPQLRAACGSTQLLLNLVCLMWSSCFGGDHKRVARF